MPRKRKTIKLTEKQYINIENDGYECINGVKDFGTFLVENESTGDTMVCKAFQLGGMGKYDAAIRKFDIRRLVLKMQSLSQFTKFKQALNKEDFTQKLNYARRTYATVVDKIPVKGEQSFSYTSKSGQPYIVYYELKN